LIDTIALIFRHFAACRLLYFDTQMMPPLHYFTPLSNKPLVITLEIQPF